MFRSFLHLSPCPVAAGGPERRAASGSGGLCGLLPAGAVAFGAWDGYLRVSLWVLLGLLAVLGVLFAGMFGRLLEARGEPPATGFEAMIGEVGVVREPVGKKFSGWVFVRGERWRAVAARDAPHVIGSGDRVEIVGFRGNAVIVRPAGPEGGPGRAS